ncbi:MAG TPA: HEAT repeat domain-containing protein [Planctomycetaceae bacterium]|nr:HEAT repeat domain-containing protein [Planctomycetaceae bacterium]
MAFAQNATPKYAFKAGQQYIYEIKIEAELPGEKQIMSGNSQYDVKSVDSSGQMSLVNTGMLVTRHEVKQQPGRFPGPPRGPRGFPGISGSPRREVTIDAQGTVVKYEGEMQLPFLLGNLALLVLEPLPKDGQRTWETKREITIFEKDGNRFPHMPFGPRQQESGTKRSAHETVTYSLGAVNGNLIDINRKIDLRTDEKANGESVFEQTGDGKIVFNMQEGVPQSYEMKLTMKVNQENTTVKVPTTISAHRLTEDEVKQAQAAAAEAHAKAQDAIAEANRPKELTDEDIDQALQDLKARDVFKVNGALDRLGKAIVVDNRREQVTPAIVALLQDRDDGIRSRAVKAIGVWGSQEQVPTLIELLDDQNPFVKGNAFEALGKLGGKKAADALAERVPPFFGRREASQALQQMGEVAEAPVLPLLKNKDWTIQSEACKILAVVGTRKSLADLEKIAKSDKGPLGIEAKKAADAVRSRAKEAGNAKKDDAKPAAKPGAAPKASGTTGKSSKSSTTGKPKR